MLYLLIYQIPSDIFRFSREYELKNILYGTKISCAYLQFEAVKPKYDPRDV